MGVGSHQAMTLSVAAGSRTGQGHAFGVAPGARVPPRRSRTVEVTLPRCRVTGRAWADATNAHDLDGESAPIRFEYAP
jgi:hypothetical protein